MSTVLLAEMSWTDVAEAVRTGARVVALPVGSTEQHGPHLPLATDTVMAESAARMAAERAGDVLVAPAIPFGTSENHVAFPGTASVRLDTLKAMLVDVGETLLRHGFDAIVIVNGHSGNAAAINAAAHELRQRTDAVVAAVTWWFYVEQSLQHLEDPFVWHAGEFETSMMLALYPELVHMERAVNDVPRAIPLFPFTGKPGLPKVDLGSVPTGAAVASGTFGDARLATAEKGTHCVDEAIGRLADVFRALSRHAGEIRTATRQSAASRAPHQEEVRG
jgi:creatinine amidohydrolase